MTVDNLLKTQYITLYYGLHSNPTQHTPTQEDFTEWSSQCETQQHEQAQKASVQAVSWSGPKVIMKKKHTARPYFLHVALHSNTWIALLQVALIWCITALMVTIPVLLYLTK